MVTFLQVGRTLVRPNGPNAWVRQSESGYVAYRRTCACGHVVNQSDSAVRIGWLEGLEVTAALWNQFVVGGAGLLC